MIAIQTNDCLYVINMELAEFLESVANDALWESNPLIRAKVQATFYNNDAMHFLSPNLSEIKLCARQVGEQFTLNFKPVQSVKDLEFYVTENGDKYSCEEAYLLDMEKKKKEVSVPAEEKVVSPEVPAATVVVSPEVPNPESKVENLQNNGEGKKVDEESTSITPNPTVVEVEETATTDPEEEVHEEEIPEEEVEELDASGIVISEESKRAAAALDNMIRSFPNITDLPEEYKQGMAAYVQNCRDMFRGNAIEYLTNSPMYQEDVEHLMTDYYVPNALGKEQDMIDSFLVFPAAVRILSKRNLDNKFLTTSLINSTFMRVCPIGYGGDYEDRTIQAYVQEFKISREDLKDAEALILSKYGLKSLRGVTPEQKRLYFEEALETVYNNKYGSIASSRNRKLVNDIDEYLEAYAKDYYFPAIEEWEVSGQIEYDAREKVEQFPIPIITQLQNLNIEKKPASVKIRTVYSEGCSTIDEMFKNQYFELNADYLGEYKNLIVETEDGLVLEGFYFDLSTNQLLTEEEVNNLKSRLESSSEIEIDDPFEETETLTTPTVVVEEKHEEVPQAAILLSESLGNVTNVTVGGKVVVPPTPELPAAVINPVPAEEVDETKKVVPEVVNPETTTPLAPPEEVDETKKVVPAVVNPETTTPLAPPEEVDETKKVVPEVVNPETITPPAPTEEVDETKKVVPEVVNPETTTPLAPTEEVDETKKVVPAVVNPETTTPLAPTEEVDETKKVVPEVVNPETITPPAPTEEVDETKKVVPAVVNPETTTPVAPVEEEPKKIVEIPEDLRDFTLPDGTYIAPDGTQYLPKDGVSGKDRYEFFKMMMDEQFPEITEENKTK